MHKHNAKVFFGFMTFFAKCESCIDHIDDDGNVMKRNDVMKTYFDVIQSMLIGGKSENQQSSSHQGKSVHLLDF